MEKVKLFIEALKKLEFMVVHEQFMTATARFADIVLPANTHWERNDLMRPWLGGPYFFFANKVVDSLHQSKSDLQICIELASRLGLNSYSDKSEDEWLKEIALNTPDSGEVISDYQAVKKSGIQHFKYNKPLVAFQKEIENPASFPFPTPSGKIEIYSQKLAELNDPGIPPLPKFIPTWEGRDDPLCKTYSLQLITYHFKTRAHSNFANVAILKELEPQCLWLSASDAERRKIADGEIVRIFNHRGEIRAPAHVTQRIMPGVVAIGEGAWYSPDERGVDKGACANVLTRDKASPAGSLASNTCLVEVAKIDT